MKATDVTFGVVELRCPIDGTGVKAPSIIYSTPLDLPEGHVDNESVAPCGHTLEYRVRGDRIVPEFSL